MSRYVSYSEEVRALRDGDWIDSDDLRQAIREQLDNPVYAACSLGKTRYFWTAWQSAGDCWQGSRPFASGYEETKEAAEQKGRDAAGVTTLKSLPTYERFGKHKVLHPIRQHEIDAFNRRLSNGMAAHYHRRLAVEARMQKPAKGQKTATREYLYYFWRSEWSGEWQTEAYRIVKQTARRIYVDREPRRTTSPEPKSEQWEWLDHDIRTAVVDRAILEREGSVWCRGVGHRLHRSPEVPRAYIHTPPCLVSLGLSWPCTEAEVKRAFRVRSREAHPDAGGEAERFIALQRAYEQALIYVQQCNARAA